METKDFIDRLANFVHENGLSETTILSIITAFVATGEYGMREDFFKFVRDDKGLYEAVKTLERITRELM